MIIDVKNAMDADRVRRKLEDDEAKVKFAQNNAAENAISRGSESDRFVEEHRNSSQAMLNQQDQNLDSLGNAVDRLHVVGKTINEELKSQNLLLKNLEDDMDDAGNKMGK